LNFVLPADHPSGTFWYHPHLHGSGGLQLAGGAAGALIVLDKEDHTPSQLKDAPEILLFLQEAIFNGSRTTGNIVALNTDAHSLLDLDYKDILGKSKYITVNGQYAPTAEISLNTTTRLRFVNAGGHVWVFPLFPTSCKAHLIANDGVYLDEPIETNRLILPIGSRADVLLSCSTLGTFSVVSEYCQEQKEYIVGATAVDGILLYLSIVDNGEPSDNVLPAFLPPRPHWLPDLMSATPNDFFFVGFSIIPFGINGHTFNHSASFVTSLSAVNEWTIRRTDTIQVDHPFHQHINHFQMVKYHGDHLPYNLTGLTKGSFRDTIPIEATPTVIRFKPHAFPGKQVFHCHIVTHSDLGMLSYAQIEGQFKRYPVERVPSVPYPACARVMTTNNIPHTLIEDEDLMPSTDTHKTIMISLSTISAVVVILIVSYFAFRLRARKEETTSLVGESDVK